MKILVITAECGEAQFQIQKHQIKAQKEVEINHYIISNLNLVDSQSKIYEICSSTETLNYDFIIKLDGDMLLKSCHSLSKLCRIAQSYNKSRITYKLLDYYTGRFINGVHFLKPRGIPEYRVIHESRNDYWIETISGLNIEKGRGEVLHAFNPTIDQSSRFGKHRGEKAYLGGDSNSHWRTIFYIKKNYDANSNNIELMYALANAYLFSTVLKDFNLKDALLTVKEKKIKNIDLVKFHLKKYKKPISTTIHVIKIILIEFRKYLNNEKQDSNILNSLSSVRNWWS